MKKCPVCSSISMDQDTACGVCGSDLAGVIPVDEASLDQPAAPSPAPNQRRLNKALLLVLTGPVLSLLGFLLILNLLNLGSEVIALSGLPILLIGLFATMETIGLGPTYLRYWRRGYRGRGGRFMGKYGSYDPRPREVEAEESRTSTEERDEDYPTKQERKKESFD